MAKVYCTFRYGMKSCSSAFVTSAERRRHERNLDPEVCSLLVTTRDMLMIDDT